MSFPSLKDQQPPLPGTYTTVALLTWTNKNPPIANTQNILATPQQLINKC